MRIQHNIMAMNSYRNFTNNTKAVSKNLEKLSSGYRINNAGDDAAGLAVSEKMRAQVTGLKTASKNAKDGISLVKTAEGALTEVHSMLNRMVDLAGQSANGTYDNAVDRANLQKEVGALKSEIDRIADSSNFNGIKLLDGSLGTGTTGVEATSTANTGATAGNFNAAVEFSVSGLEAGKTFTVNTTLATTGAHGITADSSGNITLNLQANAGASYTQADINDLIKNATLPASAKNLSIGIDRTIGITTAGTGTVNQVNAAAISTVKNATANGVAVTNTAGASTKVVVTATKAGVNTNTLTVTNAAGNAEGATAAVNGGVSLNLDAAAGYTASEINQMMSKAGANMTVSFEGTLTGATLLAGGSGSDATYQLGTDGTAGAGLSSGGGLTLQIGDTAESFNKMTVKVGDMHSSALGISAMDISTQEGGAAAMEAIKNAINSVSGTRGELGALQNRLDHTINNLSVMHENIQDAESTIRDTDVADEMMAYTKNNILVQSAQAMLAQANQAPQGVLQLLQ